MILLLTIKCSCDLTFDVPKVVLAYPLSHDKEEAYQ
jgi:hypothetical protein